MKKFFILIPLIAGSVSSLFAQTYLPTSPNYLTPTPTFYRGVDITTTAPVTSLPIDRPQTGTYFTPQTTPSIPPQSTSVTISSPTFFQSRQTMMSNAVVVSLSWQTSALNTGGELRLYKKIGDEDEKIIAKLKSETTSYVDTDVKNGFSYTYGIQSCINDRCSSMARSPSLFVTGTKPATYQPLPQTNQPSINNEREREQENNTTSNFPNNSYANTPVMDKLPQAQIVPTQQNPQQIPPSGTQGSVPLSQTPLPATVRTTEQNLTDRSTIPTTVPATPKAEERKIEISQEQNNQQNQNNIPTTRATSTQRTDIIPVVTKIEDKKPETPKVPVEEKKTVTATTTEALPLGEKKVIGKVSLSNGVGVGGVEVSAYEKNQGIWKDVKTNTQGDYALTLGVGTWEIQVHPDEEKGLEIITAEKNVTFSQPEKNEIITYAIVATTRSLSVRVLVRDENGTAIPGIGITLDTDNGASSFALGERRMETQKTNERGEVTFSVKRGTYFVRPIVPLNLMYQGEEDKRIDIESGEKIVTFVLKKEKVEEKVTIYGSTRFSEGEGTKAFVYAWGDNGERESVVSSFDGSFMLSLSKDTVWHIGATKDEDRKGYKTTEILINPKTFEGKADLLFIKEEAEVLPRAVSSKRDGKESITLKAEDGAAFNLPSNTLASGQVNVEIKPTVEALPQKAQEVVSTVYDITIKNTQGAPVTSFTQEAEIIIPYDENELKAQGVAVDDVIPSYFDEKLGTWISVSKFTVNKEKKQFILKVDHLTRFALIAQADVTPPTSPTNIVSDFTTPEEVTLSWVNPSTDFHHAKVYRSSKKGELGSVVATEVLSNSFKDLSQFIKDTTYYYTVRAVDRAGNESSEIKQVALTAQATSLAKNNKKETLLLPLGQTPLDKVSRVLSFGDKGEDVREVQQFLRDEGVYPEGRVTGYYGKLTKKAVQRFQDKYASEILTPNGFRRSTGMFGNATRKKMNEILEKRTAQQ